jgi:hypothetical protein
MVCSVLCFYIYKGLIQPVQYEHPDQFMEELKGESKDSIELNRLEGTFLTRRAKRIEQENYVRLMTSDAVKKATFTTQRRSLIIYAYSETPSSRANAVFFIRHGLHAEADFIFIINGLSDIDSLLPTNAPNIKVIKRENTCYDLGAYGEVLKKNELELFYKYDRFILMNSSIRGPFMPTWSKDCWSDMYFNRLSDQVKLVGLSYNCLPAKHVQSMILATDRAGLNTLLRGDPTDTTNTTDVKWANEHGNPESLLGLSSCYNSRYKAISAEISLTNLMYRSSYNVSVLMSAASSPGFYEDCFLDTDWKNVHPYETIYIKANRDIHIDPKPIKKLTRWHNNSNYSSWQICSRK